MPSGSKLLNAYPNAWVKLACDRCGRSGQHRKGNLIMKYGADIPLPDLLVKLANCERQGKFQGCGVVYTNLVPPNAS